ncbi:hypothetical protein EC835_10876 [Providencia alcalifaciens]|jgi:hypothetical protein|uniref:Uncharacterized protein n=1 Tax=Providencia alcalifaciens TaxID=126385 RepID=A0A4V2V3A8_9GAMM|nr:hypothetical protein EC835_10876 [Providencia alcalifaciens]
MNTPLGRFPHNAHTLWYENKTTFWFLSKICQVPDTLILGIKA